MPKSKPAFGTRGTMRDGIRECIGLTGHTTYQIKVATRAGAKWQTFAKRSQATQARDALRTERNNGRLVLPSKVTVSEWAARYLAGRQGIRETSRLRYAASAERIKGAFPDLPLQHMTPADVRHFRDKSLAVVANETRIAAFTLLRAMLDAAVREGVLQSSPAIGVEPVKREAKPLRSVLSPTDVAELLRHLSGHETWLPASVMAYTGMRRGEICGLTRGAVDLDRRTLTIGQNVQRLGSRIVVYPPKTHNGLRTIAITPELGEALHAHLAAQERIGLEHGLKPSASWFLFQAPKGAWNPTAPRCPVALAEAIRWRLRGTRFEKFSPHDFRHAHATDLLRHGAYLKAVAARLGDTITTVMRTYSHVVDGDDAKLAVDALRRVAKPGDGLPGAPTEVKGQVITMRPIAPAGS